MALTDKLSAIGVAIREKTGKTELLTLEQMPTEIASITTGGGSEDCNGMHIPEEGLVVTGNCQYRFSYDGWNWFIAGVGDKITTQDITNCSAMCYNSVNLQTIPFEINCKANTNIDLSSAFGFCGSLTSIPKFNSCRPSTTNGIFNRCYRLRYLPEDIESWFDWSYIDNATGAYSGGKRGSATFDCCYSLRSVPMGFLNHENPYVSYYDSMYYQCFRDCYCLDELVGLPLPKADKMAWTSNVFNSSFSACGRLKNLTFTTNEDGSPIAVNWKSQTIDLSNNIGFHFNGRTIFINYNSGITADKEVKDDATYQALKDDPDWFTCYEQYSRYNHDSAVATINSLPDTTSSGGTNTIKFKGAAGSATDGGAINTLTEEEIAVAAAKGWTVTLV